MRGVRPQGTGQCLVLEAKRPICSGAGSHLGSSLVLAVAGAQSCPALCSLWKGLWGTVQGWKEREKEEREGQCCPNSEGVLGKSQVLPHKTFHQSSQYLAQAIPGMNE